MTGEPTQPQGAPHAERPQDTSAALRAGGQDIAPDETLPSPASEPNERPTSTTDEVDRTGRASQVAPNAGFGAPGSVREQQTGLDENDAPAGGIDSADFPAAGAP